jgi:hypothetical protein
MPRATLKIGPDSPYVRRPNDRRQLAIRRLYRLNREFATDVAELNGKRRFLENGLIAVAALGLVVMGGLVQMAPSCTDATSTHPTILIGGAIKVAGC